MEVRSHAAPVSPALPAQGGLLQDFATGVSENPDDPTVQKDGHLTESRRKLHLSLERSGGGGSAKRRTPTTEENLDEVEEAQGQPKGAHSNH